MADYTDVSVVLDRSGSMQSIKTSTINGFNQFLSDQKKLDGKILLTLAQFDDQYDVMYDGLDVQNVSDLTNDSFVPRGSTALLDAVGRTICMTAERVARLNEEDRPSRVLFVIITDGGENASKEFKYASVKDLIEARKKEGWEFLFLGANIDAPTVAGQMGIAAASAMTYAANDQGTSKAFRSASMTTAAYHTGVAASAVFKPEDYEAQKTAGV